jgi:hypothetical protein
MTLTPLVSAPTGRPGITAAGDYEKDIVIWNGRLVRGPKGAR